MLASVPTKPDTISRPSVCVQEEIHTLNPIIFVALWIHDAITGGLRHCKQMFLCLWEIILYKSPLSWSQIHTLASIITSKPLHWLLKESYFFMTYGFKIELLLKDSSTLKSTVQWKQNGDIAFRLQAVWLCMHMSMYLSADRIVARGKSYNQIFKNCQLGVTLTQTAPVQLVLWIPTTALSIAPVERDTHKWLLLTSRKP